MNEKPKRRRLAFRLRTLFVVVAVLSVPLAWVAYSLNWIRERHRVLPDGVVSDLLLLPFSATPFAADHKSNPAAPGGLWLFGESGVPLIGCPSYWTREEVDRVRRLFPEADVGGGQK